MLLFSPLIAQGTPALLQGAAVCEALKQYPRAEGAKPSYESGDISPLCKPFVRMARADLDRCGDVQRDPYVAKAKTAAPSEAASSSRFTWASRNEMLKKGKGNLYLDGDLTPQLPWILRRADDLRSQATLLCCGSDMSCAEQMSKVELSICKPTNDPNSPDPCVFGGSYKMPGKGYSMIFRAIHRLYQAPEASTVRGIATKNLKAEDLKDASLPAGIFPGSIVLSSYVSRAEGAASLEPIILHEYGHACSMVKMQQASLQGQTSENLPKAFRAAQWLDKARSRCDAELEIPEGYYDFWESIGETRGLAACLHDLTTANQKQLVDKPCSGLCPGHYMEEAVGIAFSLLLGDLTGMKGGVFPATCDHVRDGQHPMVSDVVDCMAQHSTRFRERLAKAFKCEPPAIPVGQAPRATMASVPSEEPPRRGPSSVR